MSSTFTSGVAAVVVAVSLAVGSGAGSAAAAAPEDAPSWSPSDLRPSKALNPIAIGACNAGFGDVSVEAIQARGLGKVDLRCGHTGAGYVHIRTKHQKDWEQIIALAGGGALWDDLMVYAVKSALNAPMSGFPRRSPSDGSKMCYSAPVQIRDKRGVVKRTIYPSVLVSRNNKIVITAFPTNSPYCR